MPRGQALGVTYQRPEDDRHNYSEEYLRARITGAMGGRAAEEVVYGGRTTGAENDMQQATDLARQMVTRWGMSERLGPVTLAPRDDPFLAATRSPPSALASPYSEATAKVIDDEVERILQECYAEGVRLLREHRAALDRLAQRAARDTRRWTNRRSSARYRLIQPARARPKSPSAARTSRRVQRSASRRLSRRSSSSGERTASRSQSLSRG